MLPRVPALERIGVHFVRASPHGSQFAYGCWCVAGDWRRSSRRLFPSAGRVYQRSPAITSCSLIPKQLPHPSTANQMNCSYSRNRLRLACDSGAIAMVSESLAAVA